MEDLIAANPDYFFPRYGLVLQGRQQSFRGVGRFDLLFQDRYGMNILMELKAVPARYETVDQVARYRDALTNLGVTNVIMWIVAPTIPLGLREFLAHLGIEYSEIHEGEFRKAADSIGYDLQMLGSLSLRNDLRTKETERMHGTCQAKSLAGTKNLAVQQGLGLDEWDLVWEPSRPS